WDADTEYPAEQQDRQAEEEAEEGVVPERPRLLFRQHPDQVGRDRPADGEGHPGEAADDALPYPEPVPFSGPLHPPRLPCLGWSSEMVAHRRGECNGRVGLRERPERSPRRFGAMLLTRDVHATSARLTEGVAGAGAQRKPRAFNRRGRPSPPRL